MVINYLTHYKFFQKSFKFLFYRSSFVQVFFVFFVFKAIHYLTKEACKLNLY